MKNTPDAVGADAVPGTRLGLALSGGGFRAAAFHLGVLKRLEELGVLARVEALSTVSGGSITGALYALRCAQHGGEPCAYPVDELIAELAPFLTRNLRAKALFGSPRRALLALASTVSRRVSRIGLMVAELDAQLFGNATLNELPDWVVINATNLRTGKGWRFFRDRAGDYLAGATEKTDTIHVADAVAASAAYPFLTDSYAFETRWEDLRGDLITEGRWERPPTAPGQVSRWRERFGRPRGQVTFPLVDGGLYDNEGVTALRGRRVTHAIISAVAPPESDSASGFSPRRYMRIVEVMHDRLGNATRQLAHEMTHGRDPGRVRADALDVARELRVLAHGAETPDEQALIAQLAARVEGIAAVGMPPRSHQFTASAQILLHRTDLADNSYRDTPGVELDAPLDCRGLEREAAQDLARVRTDLDALEPDVMELLIAQGYFLTDLQVKLAMPDLLDREVGVGWYDEGFRPKWPRAQIACATANANAAATRRRLQSAAAREPFVGREPSLRSRLVYAVNMVFVVLLTTSLIIAGVAGAHSVWHGARARYHAVRSSVR